MARGSRRPVRSPQNSTAPDLPLKPPAQRPLERPPRPLQPAELLDALPIHPAQLPLDRGQIDAHNLALAHDGAPIDHDIANERGVAAGEKKLQRIDVHDGFAVEAVEVEHHEIGGRARRELAGPGGAGGGAAVADGEGEEFGAGLGARKTCSAMGELHQAHLADHVLVECEAVDADCDGAAASVRGGAALVT